eukprot:UN27945
MWHPGGYGSTSTSEAVTVETSEHALIMNWAGDNHGPKDTDQYVADYQKSQKNFLVLQCFHLRLIISLNIFYL